MKITRIGSASGVAIVAAVALAACGSASNASSSPSTSGGGAPAGTASAAAAGNCFSGNLNAEGSTAQQNAILQAISAYQSKCSGAKISYNGTGSGAGITSFIAKQVDFAGSDSELSPAKGEPAKASAACGSTALDIPMVTGPIAISYNLKGVSKLNLTPTLIAQLFSGKITKWNDPAIAAANPGVTLPDESVSVFFRSDSSGTTDNFTNYMHTVDPTDWVAPHAKSWTGKVGQGKAKTAGVAAAVKATPGGIGYVEWSYALQNQLPMASVNGVALTAESAGKAVAAAQIIGTGNDLSLKLDYKTTAPGAYPIILVTYEIVCSKYSNASTGTAVKDFLSYMASPTFQNTLESVGSAPLPPSIQAKVVASLNTIS
ncbi:phosphate ABC transporter substrate-binding protein PstS [Rudaeicoccus suwonensis]|uniref:Phosphate-binding protein n=1 Tax=Rudaeicoccus suwonensis TaxID=657409 RepID=A0A561DVC7_9MICO|nr:phosphate ABC transporter substrate-binding protein PstS [Rudaeicoccus suwonensis]TWE07315.1 phosphate ABC transporter substrate-binding protein (PhoT family) [Rudaeicoccus suwonensis]